MRESAGAVWSRAGDRVELGNATPLFAMTENRYHGFDIAPDGERFLILQRPPEEGHQTRMH